MHLDGGGWEARAKESDKHDPGLQLQCFNANLKMCSPLGSWLTAQPTQAMRMGIQRLRGNTLLSFSPVPNVIPNCSVYVHFRNTGEEEALWDTEQHTPCFDYYLERDIFLIL